MVSQFKLFRMLHTLKKQTKFYVFDVETWGLDATPNSFALGCIYGENYSFKSDNLDEIKNELLSPKFSNSVIFAHNALYDISTIFGNVLQGLDNKAIFNGSTFILAKYKKTTFADSFNIFPTSVEKIGDMIGFPKGITPDKFKDNKRKKLNNEDFEYCMLDCKIIYVALKRMFEKIGCVRLTLASLSMAYFRRKFLKSNIFFKENVYEFFNSYYGGRVECFRLGKVYAQKFDINSMYPHAMKYAYFPDPGKLREIEANEDNFEFILENYEGLAELTVFHKYNNFGYLPYKHEKKLIFPVGKFRGTWNLNEIRHAYNKGIIDILEFHKVIIAPRKLSIFSEFVDTLYNERKATKNEFEKYQLKIILNSLYGKFAQRKMYEVEYIEELTDETDINGKQIVPFNTERSDCYLIQEQEKYGYNTIPLFSSYVTSYARVHLLKQFEKYEINEIVYCDTDSIAVNNYLKEIETGENLGEFKKENKIIIEILGNKSYIELDGNIVLKGIPKKAKKIAENVYEYKTMVKPKTSLRRNLEAGKFITIKKNVKNEYDKRIVFEDGSTEPINLK